MKITEHLIKISGAEYGTNSNNYAILYEGGIVLIDCGYGEEQWNTMEENLRVWGHSLSEVTHVFLTHAHFDHGRNAAKVNALGAKLFTSAPDRPLIEEGNPENEALFQANWIPGKVDGIVSDGMRFTFPGLTVTAMETPGHSKGSMSYVIEVDGVRAVTAGDMFWTVPVPPMDRVDVQLGYMGSSDFSMDDFMNSLLRLREIPFDILLSGHYYIYRGPQIKELLPRAIELAQIEEKKQRGIA